MSTSISIKKEGTTIWFYNAMGSISTEVSGTSVEIEQLEVWRAYRGRRVATTLMNEVIEYAKTHGLTDIQLYCEADDEDRQADLEGFYQRLGFVFCGSDASMLLTL